MKRRNLEKGDLCSVKFNVLVRFMIVAAEKKRMVEYNELNKVFGISLEDLRDYAGFLGDYCVANDLPYLNALIINTQGKPGEDFYSWAECEENDWGEYVAECFQQYHLPMDNTVRFQNTSGINDSITRFLK